MLCVWAAGALLGASQHPGPRVSPTPGCDRPKYPQTLPLSPEAKSPPCWFKPPRTEDRLPQQAVSQLRHEAETPTLQVTCGQAEVPPCRADLRNSSQGREPAGCCSGQYSVHAAHHSTKAGRSEGSPWDGQTEVWDMEASLPESFKVTKGTTLPTFSPRWLSPSDVARSGFRRPSQHPAHSLTTSASRAWEMARGSHAEEKPQTGRAYLQGTHGGRGGGIRNTPGTVKTQQ